MRTALCFAVPIAIASGIILLVDDHSRDVQAQDVDPNDVARVIEGHPGAEVYAQHCANCHGRDLNGGGASSLIDRQWFHGNSVFRTIKYGVPQFGMPDYGNLLTDDEIRSIVDLINKVADEANIPEPQIPTRIDTYDYDFTVETWLGGHDHAGGGALEIPWAIEFAPAGSDFDALVTERPGRLREVIEGNLHPDPVAGTPEVLHEGQGGLMDVALDPDYANNGWVYLSYSHALPDRRERRAAAMTRIVRGRIVDHAWTDEEVLFEADHNHYLPSRLHYGSQFAFDHEGNLFFSIGERGYAPHAQDLTRPNGKLHRIRPDGSIPDDNPFINSDESNYPSIYSFGHRNPQGVATHPETGDVWTVEHGPMGGDEVNRIQPALNYGWPEVTYGINYNGAIISDHTHLPGMTQPNLFWRPSIAVSGASFCTSDRLPLWENDLLVGALAYEEVRRLAIEGDRVIHQEVILKNAGRVRDVVTGPDGSIYVVTNGPDAVLRLTPEN